MNARTIFDEIIDGKIPSWKIWEDERYLAFLTPFANVRGATVVIPKINPGDNVFNLDDDQITGLMLAARKVAKLLEAALDVKRVGLVFEGEAVPHVHAKLYPMHELDGDRSKFPAQKVFYPVYPGFLSTIDGPKMSDEELNELQAKIKGAEAA